MITTYQNYNHYKLPITINPLEYGRLIYNHNNTYIVWVTTRTIFIITKLDLYNEIKLYRDGILTLSYKDDIIYQDTDSIIIRYLNNYKFTFKNSELVSKVLLSLKNLLNNNNWWNYKIKILTVLLLYVFSFDWFSIESTTMLALIPKSYSFASFASFAKNTFNQIYYKIDNQIFSSELLEGYFNKFWKIISPKLHEDSHVYILLKFQFEDNNIHTIGKLIRIDHNNKNEFISKIINYMEGMGDYYNQSPFNRIIFSYGFAKGPIQETFSKSEINLMNFKDMKFPISTNPIDFGKIVNFEKIENGYLYIIHDSLNRTIIFKELEKENLIQYNKNGLEIFTFKDNKFSEGKFLRIIGSKKLFYENGNKTLELLQLDTPFIQKLKIDKAELNNFITLDIETFGEEILTPYLISFYDGNLNYSFYLADYGSVEQMMRSCFEKLFVRKYNDFNIYIHNLVKFDIIFILKYLIKWVKVKPLIHRGRIIQLDIRYGKDNQYKIKFKDSYLILLSSLDKLSKTFGIENPKSIFPHKFVKESNLNYEGIVPSKDSFFKISDRDYLNYKNSFNNGWNLRSEAIKYCEIDCISLYEIILKFNGLIFKYFNKNIHNYPTLPSLAFAIFRSNFMDEENIPKLTGNIAKDIREGYTGGSTDMFIPYGKNVKCYDVNSLYPSQMIDKDMPIGKPTKFIGDITKIEKDKFFGFAKVKVKSPENILHPIIQIKHKTSAGIKTISPVGSWTMWIFSEEMYNAMKFGYTFEILEGYLFEKGITFKSYVKFLFNLRQLYDKENPLNLIAKILLNSLYGRFGMSEINIKYEIISRKELESVNLEDVLDLIEFDDQILIALKTEPIEDNSNISIGIASAITAYSRIHMSQFKNNPKIRLFYTDTDSIYTDSELDPSLIDPKILGKLKLEYVIDEAVFLGPKSYCLKLENGKTIVKIKGLKNTSDLTIEDFKDLLQKDFYINKSHKKWFRDLQEGKITIKEQLYRIQKLDSKRKYIYSNNVLSSTNPINIKI